MLYLAHRHITAYTNERALAVGPLVSHLLDAVVIKVLTQKQRLVNALEVGRDLV